MTVRELMDMLATMPGAARVVVEGYEGGCDDVAVARRMKIRLNVHEEWYYGAHEEATEESELPESVEAVLLAGKNTNAKE